MAQLVTAEKVANLISDGDCLLTVGMTLVGACESVLEALEERYLRTGHPNHLTLIHASGQSDRQHGIQRLAHAGMVQRIIGSHWGLAPKWMDMISGNQVEAYCFPQGQMTHWLRSVASGLEGHLTQIGLGTFIDPRLEGGKMNDLTRGLDDLVRVVEVRGREYLWFEAVPIDWALVRGTTADDVGNISAEDEAMKLEILPAVFAAQRYRGKVVAQVKNLVARGTIAPRQVEIPAPHVHYVVQAADPLRQHRQTSSWYMDAAFSGEGYRMLADPAVGALDARRVIGRRALLELSAGAIVNMGTGIPNDVIGPEVVREGCRDQVVLTVESGVYGGMPVGGVDFGISRNPDALIEHPYQFDFYNGHGVDITFMGFGEMDAAGRVNATKFGTRATGAGGFIDITQPAKKVVFCGTLTTGGLSVEAAEGRLRIVHEGRTRKCVAAVVQVSFDGVRARGCHQDVLVVTERAVFHLVAGGWELTEIAPGIDLETDVLALMDFAPRVSPELKLMDAAIFRDGLLGLKDRLAVPEIR
ncbi:MAG: acyl CoA:acetate/3-ketoacid CoA transferase [Thermaerobacter sp.]|nr:acyl CoA:acetate/3-ketoacid CoA transferase [Thermaerobacter sp.]